METISCDCPDVTDEYPSHIACREVQLAHVENMCNLSKVVNRRFQFHAFPLKLEGGSASPVRAVSGFVADILEAKGIKMQVIKVQDPIGLCVCL